MRPGVVLKSIRSRLAKALNLVFLDRSDDESTTFLVSSGRSGSTLLSSIVQGIPVTRTIFEPFHPQRGIAAMAQHRYTYFRPGESVPALEDAFVRLMRGSIRSPWVEQFNPPATLRYDRRLIKLVRATLLLPWLMSRFPQCKFIYLVRYPAAVACSQVKGGWNLTPDRLLSQLALASEFDLGTYADFQWADSEFTRNLVFWAIENQVAYDCARKGKCRIIRYEDFCLNPRSEFARIEEYLGVSLPESAYEQLDRPSWSSSRGIAELSMRDRVENWKSITTPEQQKTTERALEISGLSALYPSGEVSK